MISEKELCYYFPNVSCVFDFLIWYICSTC